MRRTGWAWWTGRHLPPPRASPAAEDLTFISSCSHGLVSSQSVSYQAGLCLHIEYTIMVRVGGVITSQRSTYSPRRPN
jgi:hypothetical protein